MKIDSEKSVCFTGHRELEPETAEGIRTLVREAVKIYIKRGYNTFIAGGALGFDTIAAEEVLRLREELGGIKLVLALPCKSQTKKWRSDGDISRHSRVFEQADEVICTSDSYYPGCMHLRNRFMVDNSSVCIAYCTRDTGGSAYTCKYAEKKGRELVNLGDVVTQLTIY